MSIRSIERTIMKKKQGNNKISQQWRQFKIFQFGLEGYVNMRNKNRQKVTIKGKTHQKGEKITAKTAYN